jgi:hypothetical protein
MLRDLRFTRWNRRGACQSSIVNGVDRGEGRWEIPALKTLTADAHKRVRIPDAQPRQVFAYENTGDGRRILTEIKADTAEAFPPGSLRKYVTPERDAEMLELLRGCALELPRGSRIGGWPGVFAWSHVTRQRAAGFSRPGFRPRRARQ